MQRKKSLHLAANNADSAQKRDLIPSSPVLSVVYYPVFLNLKDKKTVVIGGGKVAERKTLSLLKAEADIIVISPGITAKIEKEKRKGSIQHINRHYRKGDLKKAFLVIAATDSPRINKLIFDEAPCLVNVVDTPDMCNFIVPSVIQRGPLTIAISTSGISPALSRLIRKELENIYGHEFSEYLKALRSIRAEAMNVIKDQKKRGKVLKSIASDKMIKMLREKGCKEVKRMAKDLLKKSKNASF